MSDMLERNPQIKHLMESGELVPDVSASTDICIQSWFRTGSDDMLPVELKSDSSSACLAPCVHGLCM